MAVSTIQGSQVPLRISTDAGVSYNKVVCLKMWSWNGTTQTSKENTQCGQFTAVGPNGWNITAQLLVNKTPGAGEISHQELKNAWNNQTRIGVRMEVPDQGQASAGGQLHEEGFGYITSIKEDATSGNLVTMDVTIEGDGNMTFVS